MSYPNSNARKPHGYLELSRSPTYSLLLAIPLFLLYEVGVLLINGGSAAGLRNAADVALKQPFLMLGVYGPLSFALALGLAAFAVYRYDWRPRRVRVVGAYLGLMLVESFVYAALFGRVINAILQPLLQVPFLGTGMEALSIPARFVLSLGAGLYEEVLFRLILVTALFFLFRRAGGWQHRHAYVAAALAGAFLFSAYHYVGPMGDPFLVHTFLYRFVAGLVLNVLYLVRGFGITAYTHALYDLLVTIFAAGG